MKDKVMYIVTIFIILFSILLATITNNTKYEVKYAFSYINNEKTYVINNYGKSLYDESISYVGDMSNEYVLIVNDKKQCSIIDQKGNVIVDSGTYDNIEEYGKLFLAYKDENIYLITGNNEVLRKIKSNKEIVSRIVNNYAVLLFDNKYHIYNSLGEIIKEFDYSKKSKLSLRETNNYGQVHYGNNEYVFLINKTNIEELETAKVSYLQEQSNVLLLKNTTNRIYVENNLIKEFKCENPLISDNGIVKCEEETVYIPSYIEKYKNYSQITQNGEYIVACNKKCDLFKENNKIISNYDDILVKNINNNIYFVTKKKSKTIIYNSDLKVTYSTRNNAELQLNYLKSGKSHFTLDGFEIKL